MEGKRIRLSQREIGMLRQGLSKLNYDTLKANDFKKVLEERTENLK